MHSGFRNTAFELLPFSRVPTQNPSLMDLPYWTESQNMMGNINNESSKENPTKQNPPLLIGQH